MTTTVISLFWVYPVRCLPNPSWIASSPEQNNSSGKASAVSVRAKAVLTSFFPCECWWRKPKNTIIPSMPASSIWKRCMIQSTVNPSCVSFNIRTACPQSCWPSCVPYMKTLLLLLGVTESSRTSSLSPAAYVRAVCWHPISSTFIFMLPYAWPWRSTINRGEASGWPTCMMLIWSETGGAWIWRHWWLTWSCRRHGPSGQQLVWPHCHAGLPLHLLQQAGPHHQLQKDQVFSGPTTRGPSCPESSTHPPGRWCCWGP